MELLIGAEVESLPELKKNVRISNRVGLHARPAAVFVKAANFFKAEIAVEKEGREVDAKSILGILSLGIEQDSIITIKATGEDAEQALQRLVDLVNNKLGESE